MQGHQIYALEGLNAFRQRVRDLSRQAVRVQTVRDQVVSDHAVKSAQIEKLSGQIERLAKVLELLRTLMDKLVLDQVHMVEDVVTKGLRTIFYDQELVFQAEVQQRYNKVAIDFYLQQGEGSVVRGPPLESFGGGPSSIASLILRLLTLLRLKKAPFLLLDESLLALSDEYVDAAGQFLQKLAASVGIDVLLVTHKQAFLDHANLAYQGTAVNKDDGTWSLGLRRLRGTRNESAV